MPNTAWEMSLLYRKQTYSSHRDTASVLRHLLTLHNPAASHARHERMHKKANLLLPFQGHPRWDDAVHEGQVAAGVP
jgi:hypothetical protein